MTWVKLDDAILDHPKVARLSPIGLAQHVAGIVWASRNLTDGIIPDRVVNRLLDWDGIAVAAGVPVDEAQEMVTAFRVNGWRSVNIELLPGGLWHDQDTAAACPSDRCHESPAPKPDELLIHDFLVYQRSREEVLAERAGKHEAKVRGGKLRAATATRVGGRFSRSDQVSPADHQQTTSPVPVPVPVPVPEPLKSKARNAAPNGAAVDNRPDQDELYLIDRVWTAWGREIDDRGAVKVAQKLNTKFGRVTVLDSLRALHGFPPDEAIRSPYAYLLTICKQAVSA